MEKFFHNLFANNKSMMFLKWPIVFFAIALFFSMTGKAMVTSSHPSLEVSSNIAPAFVRVNGRVISYYEIGLKNNSQNTIAIEKVVISAGASGKTVMSLAGLQLIAHLSNGTGRLVQPLQKVFLFVELDLPPAVKNPPYLDHVIFYTIKNTAYQSQLKISLPYHPPIVLNAPLGLGNWAAIYNPQWDRGHRRVFFSINKKSRIPGRYAIDFIKLDNEGHQAVGKEDSIKNWYGYGANVLAVSDGEIFSAIDSVHESNTLSTHANVDSANAAGNYIVLKIKDQVFAFYEHLQPGSVLVKRGDFVKAGQVIAKLGYTAQSTGPHLHFHLANDSTPFGAEGIPYVFKVFHYQGYYKDFGDFSHKRWTDALPKPSPRKMEFPLSNTVIKFHAAARDE